MLAAAKRPGLTTVSSSCPSECLSAEFTIVADRVINASQGRTFILDPTGSHLSDVMGFTQSRIANEIQTVRDYLQTTFGLTFSGLDANGEATFQNATLSYFRVPFRHHTTGGYPVGEPQADATMLSTVVCRLHSLVISYCGEHTEVRLE